MRILMVTSEASPHAKSGGLGDVLGALPQALAKQGHQVAVLLPRYGSVPLDQLEEIQTNLNVRLGDREFFCSIWRLLDRGVEYLFLDYRELYDRWGGLYGVGNGSFDDNHVRFALLSKAALKVRREFFPADIIHGHDWQAGLTGAYLDTFQRDPGLMGCKVVFTIHNMGYQGIVGADTMPILGLEPRFFTEDALKFYNNINCMKGGIVFCHAVTTVSPRYAQEIQTSEYGFQLDGLLRHHSGKLSGILNGVDYQEWNPEIDKHLPAKYSAADLSGKLVCKKALLAELGMDRFPVDRPLFGIISRFAEQKGLDLVAQAAGELLAMDAGLIVLGSGDPWLENFFRGLEFYNKDRVRSWIGYNNGLAHRIEAGCDMFLMPSRYEPCGLNQIYSLRYGTPPVVRATGGLDDTINGENGFKFWGFLKGDFLGAVATGIREFENPQRWQTRVKTAMAADYSWDVSASKYSELYQRLL
jgi:starch synthase